MRWKSKQKPLDEVMEETWFAWKPVFAKNGDNAWLEKVTGKVIYWRGFFSGSIYRDVLALLSK